MELAALEEEDPKSLRRLARRLLETASIGDNSLAAIKEVADRLDGKPAQAVIGDEENPLELIHRIERVIVPAPDQDR
jgi:hypothetical protein